MVVSRHISQPDLLRGVKAESLLPLLGSKCERSYSALVLHTSAFIQHATRLTAPEVELCYLCDDGGIVQSAYPFFFGL